MPTNPYYLTFGGNALTIGAGGVAVGFDHYNPLGLPAKTIRVEFESGYTPTPSPTVSQTFVQVTSSPNIWDITWNNTMWYNFFKSETYLKKVLGANSTGVNNMKSMFEGCTNLTSIPPFDMTSVTNCEFMFDHASSLSEIPDTLDISHASLVNYMFAYCAALRRVPTLVLRPNLEMQGTFIDCFNVESGALALYNYASNLSTPPRAHTDCFWECGKYTVTGAQELAQIPRSWGGTGT